MQEYISVGALNEYIGSLLENDDLLQGVWVKGEISGFRLYQQSGHMYFTLKDGEAAVSCVMFRSRTSSLKFKPEDGMEVLLFGSVAVFSKQGKYQLYAEKMLPFGVGNLFLYLEQLKKELAQKGYFAEERKKPLPTVVNRIGVVTSQDGAALRDILKVLHERQPGVEVVIVHSSVQGIEAPRELAAGLRALNQYAQVDLIIIGRGGGSMEDLMAFNSEEVVEAIYESAIPVISAVGHEVDFCLSDLAADVRAATPTQAAQLAVPDRFQLQQDLEKLKRSLLRGINRNLEKRSETLDRLMMRKIWYDPQLLLEKQFVGLEEKKLRLQKAIQEIINSRQYSLQIATAGLDNLSPLKVMARGYAMLTQGDRLISSVDDLAADGELTARLSDGKLNLLIKSKEKL
ncbi:Exonuclease VII, large subunit [Syntrophomonas zehnderi OL-4]|uniref:Exodeoxyribonuclease 7 large subunit n=1 Tax=Syntrophomonas zehnderi OL-4 TaxID=690567 RepID=A0A0E4C8H4_9FIRM|nr:exodeoxyribonuclease VII large subunit [Syntrophomonas zehnderi]CFX49725.1 Exonuclease VII, large subunit [Syntrophomonas zehnderi OL-4]